MGSQELIEALRLEGEEKAGAIRREAEAEAERIRDRAEDRRARLREEYAKRQVAAAAGIYRDILAEAENKGRLIRLAAESTLAERLYGLARHSLGVLGGDDHEALFAALAEELPRGTWERVRVNPADEEVAGRLFPAAETVTDSAITGGMEVMGEGMRLHVINTLEKRLERGWPEILPALFKEVLDFFP